MEYRLFGDFSMFVLSLITLICFIFIGVLQFRDRDTNWVWYLVRTICQVLFVIGFYLEWQNPNNILDMMSVGEITRPALVGLWAAGIFEGLVNLFNSHKGLY